MPGNASYPRQTAADVQAGSPASMAWRSAWYEERTNGPEATWLKPKAIPNASSCVNSSGVQ
jgi:hypothetical protein